jgi:hypothetical protein
MIEHQISLKQWHMLGKDLWMMLHWNCTFSAPPSRKKHGLRGRARPASSQLTMTCSNRLLQGELSVQGQVLLSGIWDFQISLDGKPAVPRSDYIERRRISNQHVRYWELEILLTRALRLQRHLLYAKKAGFLFLADAVLGKKAGQLHYRGRWPLTSGITFRSAGENTEGFLCGKRRLAAVLPLALPEWRNDHRCGTLCVRRRTVELQQTVSAPRFFAPLWFDLKPNRFRRRLTWRPLTVAENLTLQPSHVAVGYRVALGRQQWLCYRSLGLKGTRSLLGHHLYSEFLLARFHPDGRVEPLLEIR